MRSREELEIAMHGSSSWMPYAPQRVKGLDDDDLRRDLPSGLFPLGLPTKTLYAPPLSLIVLHASTISFFQI